MSGEIKHREPGERAFPSRPELVLVPSAQEVIRPAPEVEQSPEVREMLREMNRKRAATRQTDTPDAA